MKCNAFTWSGWASFMLLTVLFSNTTGCVSLFGRTTTVYGRVIDDTEQPIDSMMVSLHGAISFSGGLELTTTYTDSDGNYKITYDIPKDYYRADVYIYPSTSRNSDKYKERYLVYEDGNLSSGCCKLTIGKKKKFDFVLQSK